MVIEVRNIFDENFRISQGSVLERYQVLVNLIHIPDVTSYWHTILSNQEVQSENSLMLPSRAQSG